MLIFNLNSMLSNEMWITDPNVGYYGKIEVNQCAMTKRTYSQDVSGAVLIAPNLHGVYRPLFYVGPEYILEKSLRINTIENIIIDLKKKGLQYEL